MVFPNRFSLPPSPLLCFSLPHNAPTSSRLVSQFLYHKLFLLLHISFSLYHALALPISSFNDPQIITDMVLTSTSLYHAIYLPISSFNDPHIITDMVQVQLPDMQTGISSRFCFDTRPFLTSCDCDLEIVTCEQNPCLNVTCDAFPEAECRIDLCDDCQAKWYHMGLPVDCGMTRGEFLLS